jgi:hypothetical protein
MDVEFSAPASVLITVSSITRLLIISVQRREGSFENHDGTHARPRAVLHPGFSFREQQLHLQFQCPVVTAGRLNGVIESAQLKANRLRAELHELAQ